VLSAGSVSMLMVGWASETAPRSRAGPAPRTAPGSLVAPGLRMAYRSRAGPAMAARPAYSAAVGASCPGPAGPASPARRSSRASPARQDGQPRVWVRHQHKLAPRDLRGKLVPAAMRRTGEPGLRIRDHDLDAVRCTPRP
jgi:hypothetical protein